MVAELEMISVDSDPLITIFGALFVGVGVQSTRCAYGETSGGVADHFQGIHRVVLGCFTAYAAIKLSSSLGSIVARQNSFITGSFSI